MQTHQVFAITTTALTAFACSLDLEPRATSSASSTAKLNTNTAQVAEAAPEPARPRPLSERFVQLELNETFAGRSTGTETNTSPASEKPAEAAIPTAVCSCGSECPCSCARTAKSSSGPDFAAGVYYVPGVTYQCIHGELHWPTRYQTKEVGQSTANFTTPSLTTVNLTTTTYEYRRGPFGAWWKVPVRSSTTAPIVAQPFATKVSSVVVSSPSQRRATPSTPVQTHSTSGSSLPPGFRLSPCASGRCSLPR